MSRRIRSYRQLLFLPAFLFVFLAGTLPINAQPGSLTFFSADNPYIQYTGRIDFTDPKLPRFWQPGVYITIRFTGPDCKVILNDEILWGKNHNYLEIVVDGKATRIQTKARTDTITVAQHLS